MAAPNFRELITPFLKGRLNFLERKHGRSSNEFQALARQYVYTADEKVPTPEANLRHFEADILGDSGIPAGVERLYRRTLVIEPTLACAAHCRYCIRANYPRNNLSENQLEEIARYCGSPSNRQDLREVLVTGGDVLLVPGKVNHLLEALIHHAPNIRIARIATRIPVQDPARIHGDVLRIFEDKKPLRLELATQINHPVELCEETVDAYQRIMDRGVRIYAQNVLLRGVNDDPRVLTDLYDLLRDLGIESHYLFHCVPLKGMAHLRTSIARTLELARALGSSGAISGRAKPQATVMTDIGKIVLYEGTVLSHNQRQILLQSEYTVAQRRRWNAHWRVPDTAEVDANGRLRVWYLDGSEEDRLEDAHEGQASEPSVRLPVLQKCG